MYAVIYDGNCNLCVTLVQLLEKLDRGRQFSYVPMQDAETLRHFEVSAADCELGMLLIDQSAPQDRNRRWQGSNAAEEIGRLLPMGEVFVQVYRAMPGVRSTGDRVYTYVRDNRYDLFGQRDTTYWPSYPFCTANSCQQN
jgi:predicted DCC family thiol-disulfide oxidoreductase YuxK